MKRNALSLILALLLAGPTSAQDPTVKLVPLPGHTASFEQRETVCATWHFGKEYPRPFFYPFVSPTGKALTRMGHPGAPNHDHHRSIWFAHHDVSGIDFWSDSTKARVRQKQWLAYEDGEEEAVMAVLLGWYDAEGRELMEQELVAAWRVGEPGLGAELELQSTFKPVGESVDLGRTNFGFLGVRMAKRLSVHFGEGVITDSEGREGEKQIFGQRARWVAYSGPAKEGSEGIVYFDHPSNPRYPTYWHVREDGWMGASFGMKEAFSITREKPLTLRYLLLAHNKDGDAKAFDVVAGKFAARPPFVVEKSERPHRQFEVSRAVEVPKE